MGFSDRFLLNHKVAVVSGGARGIGRSCALAMAEMGADIAILDLLDASSTVGDIQKLGRKSISFQVDIRNEREVEQAFDKISERFGAINVVLSNAGIAFCEDCEKMSYKNWEEVISTNLSGNFLVTRAAGRRMIAAKTGGSIILTASMSGFVVNYPQNQVGYNSSKAGVIQLTHSLACEWARYGIRVNCISPGYVSTNMTPPTSKKEWMDAWLSRIPMKRIGKPDELCGAVVYLASDASSYTTGSNLVIDGGYSCY